MKLRGQGRLLLEVVEIITHCVLVSARDLVLVERTLRIALGGGRDFDHNPARSRGTSAPVAKLQEWPGGPGRRPVRPPSSREHPPRPPWICRPRLYRQRSDSSRLSGDDRRLRRNFWRDQAPRRPPSSFSGALPAKSSRYSAPVASCEGS